MKPIGCEGIGAETIENPAGSDLDGKTKIKNKRAGEDLMWSDVNLSQSIQNEMDTSSMISFEKGVFQGCHWFSKKQQNHKSVGRIASVDFLRPLVFRLFSALMERS